MTQLDSAERTLTRIIRAAFPLGGQATSAADVAVADWSDLARQAERHKLAPLLYSALNALGWREEPPAWVVEQLRQSYVRTLAVNARRYGELEQLLDLLEREHIPVVLLKGCALAATLYADMAHRPMSDLDLLIHKPDLGRVAAILTARGYSPCVEVADGFQQEFLCERAYVRKGQSACMVELHWHVFNLPYYLERVPVEWFWQRTTGLHLNGRRAFMFAPEAQILHLASHFIVHHRGQGLRWSYDMALLLARYGGQIQWDVVIDAARQFELTLALQAALAYVEEVWGVGVPAEARERVRTYMPLLRERIVFAVVTAPIRDALNVWDALTARGLKRQCGYLLARVFPQHAYMRQRYGMTDARLAPLYYTWRTILGLYKIPRSALSMAANTIRQLARETLAASKSKERG